MDEFQGRCGTCVHWVHRFPDPYNEGVEVTVDPPWMYRDGDWRSSGPAPGEWGHCTFAGELGVENTSQRFYVMDGSEYKAHLYTRSDFGCIDWAGGDE